MDQLRIIFTVIYILVDLAYVVYSKPVYDYVVKQIQGSSMRSLNGKMSYFAFVGAYTCMALGWYFFAAGTATLWAKTMHSLYAAFLAGLVFGLTVIGTFNFTLYLMFDKYTIHILLRDMLWGVGWATTATVAYMVLRGTNVS